MANAIDQLTDRVLVLGRLTIVRRAITAVAVTISAVLQTFLIQAFIQPADLLPSGLTGVAVLLDRVTSLGGVHIDISLGMLALNIPVALLCWSGISKRFVIFSMMQVVLSSLFLNVFHFAPFLGDKIMLIIFGGVVSGLGAAIALKSGASTGGTDFIALWVSNHTGKTIWGVIFGFNCFILAIFGFMFGWDKAAYSIVFQFISTKTIDSFYRRYDRVTLQITTRKADEVMTAYVDHFQHGISCAEVIGGYSREKMYLLHAVVSTYESQDIIKLVCDIDPGAVINVAHAQLCGRLVGRSCRRAHAHGRSRSRQARAHGQQAGAPQRAGQFAAGRRQVGYWHFAGTAQSCPLEPPESLAAFGRPSFAQIKPTKMKLSLFGREGVSFYHYEVT